MWLSEKRGQISCASAAVVCASLMVAVNVEQREPKLLFDLNPMSVQLAALQDRAPVPAWLTVPARSTTPVATITHAESNAGRVAYKSFQSAHAIASHHRQSLKDSGLELISMIPQNRALRIAGVHLGVDPATGREVQITVRDLGKLRAVEVIYRGPEPTKTAMVQ